MIKREPINLSYQISVTDRKVHALHVLFSVSVAYNGVGYQRMQAASHGIGFPAMPEVMNPGIGSNSRLSRALSVQDLSRGLLGKEKGIFGNTGLCPLKTENPIDEYSETVYMESIRTGLGCA
jgi:hypothetical protein